MGEALHKLMILATGSRHGNTAWLSTPANNGASVPKSVQAHHRRWGLWLKLCGVARRHTWPTATKRLHAEAGTNVRGKAADAYAGRPEASDVGDAEIEHAASADSSFGSSSFICL